MPLEYTFVILNFVTISIEEVLDKVTVAQLVTNFLTFY